MVSVPVDLPEIEKEEALKLPNNDIDIQVSNSELESELLQALGEDNIGELEFHEDLAKQNLSFSSYQL